MAKKKQEEIKIEMTEELEKALKGASNDQVQVIVENVLKASAKVTIQRDSGSVLIETQDGELFDIKR